ncbi:unnamed protein product [Lactuca saligna]|uniref:Uncharacterized protein n=1 Tax=Lactuca saligna TaxID=75948 RepID=A0AA35YZG2_LACSI|nr:unnamed protein product [Lactuca saligna]
MCKMTDQHGGEVSTDIGGQWNSDTRSLPLHEDLELSRSRKEWISTTVPLAALADWKYEKGGGGRKVTCGRWQLQDKLGLGLRHRLKTPSRRPSSKRLLITTIILITDDHHHLSVLPVADHHHHFHHRRPPPSSCRSGY